jgi:transposase InsO family protein
MKKFKIKPYRKRKSPAKPDDQGKPVASYPNVSLMMCAIVVDYLWVSDFTYIKFKTYFIYLATIMDQYSREIVGWNVSRYHNAELVIVYSSLCIEFQDNIF